MRTVVIIPARLESTRLPQKVLLTIAGKSLIHHVFERASLAMNKENVFIATDNQHIFEHCLQFTKNVIITKHHNSGSDRIAEAIHSIPCNYCINVQADEPFIEPQLIKEIAKKLHCGEKIVSAYYSITDIHSFLENSVVKVVLDKNNYALYFSRTPIPHTKKNLPLPCYAHIGVYGFLRNILLKFTQLLPSHLEKQEHLEQLRLLENGYKIKMVFSKRATFGIDTEKDLKYAQLHWNKFLD